MILKKAASFLLVLSLGAFLSAQINSAVRIASNESPSPSKNLADAYNAYHDGDYQSAVFLFRKALADRQNQNDGALYLLVMADMHIEDYKTAFADAEYFLASYPHSEYVPIIKYQQGRALYYMGDYDKALMVLGDFCHENPSNMMFPSALFWIAECFYAGYNFPEAKPFYERVVNDFPKEAKAVEAKYRLDTINAKEREQKILYLLQQTGENYLASKEDYEKTLRRYELEDALGFRKSQEKNAANKDYEEFQEKVLVVNSALESADEVAEKPAQNAAELTERPVQAAVPEQVVQNAAAQSVLQEKPVNAEESFLDALMRLKMAAAEAQTLLDGEVGK